MKTAMRWMLTATAALVITTGLVAQGPGGHRGRGFGGPGAGMFGGPGGGFFGPMLGRHLDLTEAQREQVKAIFEASRADTQAIHEQLKGLHEQIRSAVETGNTAEVEVLAILFCESWVQVVASDGGGGIESIVQFVGGQYLQVLRLLEDDSHAVAADHVHAIGRADG